MSCDNPILRIYLLHKIEIQKIDFTELLKRCTKSYLLTVLGAEQSKMADIIKIVIAGVKCKLLCNNCLQI